MLKYVQKMSSGKVSFKYYATQDFPNFEFMESEDKNCKVSSNSPQTLHNIQFKKLDLLSNFFSKSKTFTKTFSIIENSHTTRPFPCMKILSNQILILKALAKL